MNCCIGYKEVLQQEYTQPPTFSSRHFRWVHVLVTTNSVPKRENNDHGIINNCYSITIFRNTQLYANITPIKKWFCFGRSPGHTASQDLERERFRYNPRQERVSRSILGPWPSRNGAMESELAGTMPCESDGTPG